jgi:hypothetical protein
MRSWVQRSRVIPWVDVVHFRCSTIGERRDVPKVHRRVAGPGQESPVRRRDEDLTSRVFRGYRRKDGRFVGLVNDSRWPSNEGGHIIGWHVALRIVAGHPHP